MCGATEGGLSLDGVNVAKESVIQGQVLRGDEPVGNAYVRLLDRTGEFTAEVPTSATGHFRFFAAPGEWTLRTLAPKAEVNDLIHTGKSASEYCCPRQVARPLATTANRSDVMAIVPVTAMPYAALSALELPKETTRMRQPTMSALFTSGM